MSRRAHTVVVLCAVTALAGCGSSSSSSTSSAASSASGTSASAGASASSAPQSSSAGQIGPEGVPVEGGTDLGAAGTTGTGKVDGISCGATEQLAYHIHAHLAVYLNGQPRALPGGIGIPGSTVQQGPSGPLAAGGQCIYWLHTHVPDGVIHVESPTQRIYTLGNFFDVWRQPLSRQGVAGAKGTVTAFVDGRPYTGDPRGIRLDPHTVIQLDVGQPLVPFQSMSWSGLGL